VPLLQIVFANPHSLTDSICKLAIAGKQAGFSIKEMIGLLNAGMTVKTLLDLITERIDLMGLVDSDLAPKEYRG
jgi:hypothetical protein